MDHPIKEISAMIVDSEKHRPHNPHVQTLRVPSLNEIDYQQLRVGRLERLQAKMNAHDMPICLLYTPANIRYATGTDIMGVWTVSTFARFCMVPAQGKPVLFEYEESMHISERIVDDVRPVINWQFLGVEGAAEAAEWAKTVKATMREYARA